MLKIRRNKKQDAFTLIELLVVIAIIGLLASVVLASLSAARAKSRDAKRVGDINQLQKALELYYSQNSGYPSSAGSWVSDCSGSSTWNTTMQPLVTAGTVAGIPNDPQRIFPYCYFYMAPGTYFACDNSNPHPYFLLFATESSTYSLPLYSIQGEGGSKARYCLWP